MNIQISSFIVAAILQVSSPSFKNNDFIPRKFSCEGENISPALKIKNIPHGAKTLAIIVLDPDAAPGGSAHWVIWNLEPSSKIREKAMNGDKGNNANGEIGYTGPCPPSGIHHYLFTVYALDTRLELPETSGKKELDDAMKGHVLAEGTIIGLYKKAK